MDFLVKDSGIFQLGIIKMGSGDCNILILRGKLLQRSTQDGVAQKRYCDDNQTEFLAITQTLLRRTQCKREPNKMPTG